MLNNVFVGTDITDVNFKSPCNCTIETLEKLEKEDHFITVGEKKVGGVKPTNFHPTLEKGEVFILLHGEKFIKITVK